MASITEKSDSEDTAKVALWNNPKARALVFQVLLIGLILWSGWYMYSNLQANLERQNIASGFGFLNTTAGFGIIQALVPYSETSTFGTVFIVGLLNTILVSVIGIFFATMLGFLLGISRLSHNWVISKLATVYIETLRNIPLLLQIFFWYFAVLRSVPGKRDKWSLLDSFHLNIMGFHAPKPIFEAGSSFVVYAVIAGIIASFFIKRWSTKRQMETGQTFPVLWTSLGLIIGIPLVVFFAMGMPMHLDYALFKDTGSRLRQGFQAGHGMVLIPEFLALLLALSMYTATFIAEIVRAGILAVSHGQTEAASALGLRSGMTLRLVVIPQALRVIIPPLTSQYLNLIKNSSLAVAIAYPDLVSVFAGTTLNQTGQAVEIIIMTMLVYLFLSLVTSMFMNWYNAHMALVDR
ncbi:MAG: amino acid ABC transporter permease [Hyphomicrobiales bacterium]|nr:MAG: amino acid ABC transporter permease [Hyphomicrobiales bacterium]